VTDTQPLLTGVFINEIPHGDTSTSINLHTSRDDVVVVESLLGKATSCSLRSDVDESNVELGNVNVEVKGDEGFHLSGKLGDGGRATDFKVRLESDTVDLDTTLLQVGEGVDGAGSAGTSSLDAVVVVDELDGSLGLLDGLAGCLEGDGEESRANDLVEGVGGVPASAAGEGLVDDVPGEAAAAPVTDDVGDVVLEDVDHGSVGDASRDEVKKPLRVLVVPAKVVASEVFAVVFGNVDGDVSTNVGEVVSGGLGLLPLHVVGRSDLTKDASVVENGHVFLVLLLGTWDISGSSEPELASSLGKVVEERSSIGDRVGELVDGDISGVNERSWRRDGGSSNDGSACRSEGVFVKHLG